MKNMTVILLASMALAAENSKGAMPDPGKKLTLPELVSVLDKARPAEIRSISAGESSYKLQIHSAEIGTHIKASYNLENINQLRGILKGTTTLKIGANSLVKAADRDLGADKKDPTNYDAVWLRDSLWVYLGMRADPARRQEATAVLLKMLDYISAPEQIGRLKNIVADPTLLVGKNAPMAVIHIRFDGASTTYNDVQVEGKPQSWNHKQNDALGLLFDLVLRAVAAKEITPSRLEQKHLLVLGALPSYFKAIHYYQMEDAGSWEEIERVNSSSIGLVTSGLERFSEMLGSEDKEVAKLSQGLLTTARSLGKAYISNRAEIDDLIQKGYQRLQKQIAAGGESPLYPTNDPRYRQSDAALLNLIYPATLKKLSLTQKEAILKAVSPLIGEVGIRRYLKDSYQSANFWFEPPASAAKAEVESKTADTSSAEDFNERGKQFSKNSEAQWFFDSWYSQVMAEMYRQTHEKKYLAEQVKFFNRSLAQVTSSKAESLLLGADGKTVPALALPESYNTIIQGDKRYFVPSPITPLNWAKASMLLALQAMELSVSSNIQD
jgi:hypothetical protein